MTAPKDRINAIIDRLPPHDEAVHGVGKGLRDTGLLRKCRRCRFLIRSMRPLERRVFEQPDPADLIRQES